MSDQETGNMKARQRTLRVVEAEREADITKAFEIANEKWAARLAVVEAERDAAVKALAGLDGPIAWLSENYPAAVEAMPTDLFHRIADAGATLASLSAADTEPGGEGMSAWREATTERDAAVRTLERIRENARSWHGPPTDTGHERALAVIATWCDEALNHHNPASLRRRGYGYIKVKRYEWRFGPFPRHLWHREDFGVEYVCDICLDAVRALSAADTEPGGEG